MTPPEPFGPFRLEQRLHVGFFTEVWRARGIQAPWTDRDVVVKRALPTTAEKPEHREIFAREIALHRQIRHENIVSWLADGTRTGLPYLVLEAIDGPRLATVRDAALNSGKPVPRAVCRYIALCVARALACLHGQTSPLVHRDVAPDNVLLGRNGRVVVCDLGAAATAGARDALTTQIFATPGYAAPEQLAAEPLDARADVFSLGILVGELIVGRRVSDSADSWTRETATQAAEELRRQLAGETGLAPVVARMVAPDASLRPADASGIVHDIQALENTSKGAREVERWVAEYISDH